MVATPGAFPQAAGGWVPPVHKRALAVLRTQLNQLWRTWFILRDHRYLLSLHINLYIFVSSVPRHPIVLLLACLHQSICPSFRHIACAIPAVIFTLRSMLGKILASLGSLLSTGFHWDCMSSHVDYCIKRIGEKKLSERCSGEWGSGCWRNQEERVAQENCNAL